LSICSRAVAAPRSSFGRATQFHPPAGFWFSLLAFFWFSPCRILARRAVDRCRPIFPRHSVPLGRLSPSLHHLRRLVDIPRSPTTAQEDSRSRNWRLRLRATYSRRCLARRRLVQQLRASLSDSAAPRLIGCPDTHHRPWLSGTALHRPARASPHLWELAVRLHLG